MGHDLIGVKEERNTLLVFTSFLEYYFNLLRIFQNEKTVHIGHDIEEDTSLHPMTQERKLLLDSPPNAPVQNFESNT